MFCTLINPPDYLPKDNSILAESILALMMGQADHCPLWRHYHLDSGAEERHRLYSSISSLSAGRNKLLHLLPWSENLITILYSSLIFWGSPNLVNLEGTLVNFKLDTVPQANALPTSIYSNLKNEPAPKRPMLFFCPTVS